jgi:predicted NBD/HSP70 family sugar kinase
VTYPDPQAEHEPRVGNCDVLANRQIPDLVPEQVERFTFEALQGKPVRSFDPQATLQKLRTGAEKTVVAVDIGGDKLIASSYDVRDGLLLQLAEVLIRRGDGGSGYLDGLEEVAELARRKTLSLGISFAGPIDGTKILASPNLPIFAAELHDRYGGDFAGLLPVIAVANDAEAGIMAGALEAAKRYPETRNVIYVINGSGIGGAVLTSNKIFAAEPGHIQVEARLNPFGQRKPCGMLGATYVCVEVVAASKAGVEDIWLQQQGKRLGGREIAAKYLAGDLMALELYDNSALVTAHVIKGIARAFDLPRDFDGTVIVGHGGIFEVPGYRERMWAILEKNLSSAPRMLFTRDFSTNTCLDGAAIAAAIGGSSGTAQ